MREAMAALGKSRFDDMSDNDALAQKALEDGRLKAEWSYVAFDEDSLPTPRKVPALVLYGENLRDKARVLTYKDKYDHPTWRAVRKGRRPTVFASRELAIETVEEHLATAEHFGIVTGNLKHFQVVPLSDWEAAVQNDPGDKIARRQTSIALALSKREEEAAAEKTAAIEAELSASKPVSTGDWHAAAERQIQQRVRSDGTTVYRARVAGEHSPSFESLEDAIAWRDQ
jgi:hypothetical protein